MPNVDLSSLFKSDPAAQELGLGFLGQERQMNDQDLQTKKQAMDLEALMAPLRRQQMQGQIDTTQATLPGIQGQSTMLKNKANIDSATYHEQLDKALKGYSQEDRERELKNLGATGQMFSQVGAYVGSIPAPAVHATAKQLLGSYWRPEFEKMSPSELGDTLSTAGKWMTESQSKFQMQTAGLGQKADTAVSVANIQAQAKLDAAKAAAAAKKQPAESMSQYEARIRKAAEEGDPHAAAEVAKLESDRIKKAIAAAEVPDALKRQLLGMDPVTAPSQQGGMAGAMSKLPQGTKDNGDGTFTLPDGRRVRPKQ